MLGHWKGEVEGHAVEAFPGHGTRTTEHQQIHELEGKNRRLRIERNILKKPRPSLPKSTPKLSIY